MVWSDPEVRTLSREFVTVAEEVHFIYPEGQANLDRLKGNEAHEFFKTFGTSMPDEDWNDPGTKQGIYMIGPNAEYLEGGGAISGGLDGVKARMRTALKRWKRLRKDKGYANNPVPAVDNIAPPEIEGQPLTFRVFLRDLPRGKGDRSGRRFTSKDLRGIWPDFVQWAWNINWVSVDDPAALVPKGKREESVDPATAQHLCRTALVDNVRGQNPRWRNEHVQQAELKMRRVDTRKGKWVIEYEGEARMDSGSQRFHPHLYGRGVFDPKARRFESLEIVAIGEREGAGRFNQRGRDLGPAPMGIALVLSQ